MHVATYADQPSLLPIHIAIVSVVGFIGFSLFATRVSRIKARIADGMFSFIGVGLLIFSVAEFNHYGTNSFVGLAWVWGFLAVMSLSYYLSKRIMKNSSKMFIMIFALLFVFSGSVLTELIFVAYVLPCWERL